MSMLLLSAPSLRSMLQLPSKAKKQGGAIQIKFALEPKLTINKPRRDFDECNLSIPPSLITKKTNDPLQPNDDGTLRHQIGTTICKCFNDVEHKGEIVDCDHDDQLHQILHSDGDQEQMCGTLKSRTTFSKLKTQRK